MTVFDGDWAKMIAEVLRSQPRKRELRLTSLGWVQRHEGAPNARACVRARARARARRGSHKVAPQGAGKNAKFATRRAPTTAKSGFLRAGNESGAGTLPVVGPAPLPSAAGPEPASRRVVGGCGGILLACERCAFSSWESPVLLAAIGAVLRSFLPSFRRKPPDKRLDTDLETGRTL